METFYKAYSKQIENKTYYFVKKYLSFPEFQDVNDFVEGYGMHTEFNKACNIAGLDNQKVRDQLLHEIQGDLHQAKVIDLKTAAVVLTKKIVR